MKKKIALMLALGLSFVRMDASVANGELKERFHAAVESQVDRYRKAIADDGITPGELTFDVRQLTYDFSRQCLPVDILPSKQTADSVMLAKELPGAAVGQLAFAAKDGTHHIFSSWIAERIQRPLAWMADGYPARPSADLANLTNFIGRVIHASQSDSQHAVKVSATPVDRTAVVKSAFFGRKYEIPFDRAFVAFIDDNPLANWGHAARLVFVKDDLSAFEVWFISEPVKVEVDSRAFDLTSVCQDVDEESIPNLDEIRQMVVQSNAIEAQNSVSVDGDVSHSYAILISGGGRRDQNHTRYWGDMAAVYSTLTQTYKMPKTNIIVCMSDGTSPNADVSYGTASSQSHGLFSGNSSPLDLDGDGDADVDYSATQTSVKNAFASMSNKLTASDQLFVFITDHGLPDEDGVCKLVLWGEYFMPPSELSGLTADLPCPVLFAFEFCYSGAFINALKSQSGGRAIATAASKTESSGWNKTSKLSGVTRDQGTDYMNPWVYYFVGAMRGIVPRVSIEPWGNGNYTCTDADTSHDGWVSIKEASDYAKSKIKDDGYPEEPNYGDSPNGIGNDLCLIKKDSSLPTIPSAPTVRISGTTLSWDAVSGANYYKVYRSTNPYEDPAAVTDWRTDRRYTVTKPTAEGTCYFYFVKAASAQDDATASPFNAVKVVTGDNTLTQLPYSTDRNYVAYNDDTEFHLFGSGAINVTPYNASACMQTTPGNIKFTSKIVGSGITVTANGTSLATSPSIQSSLFGKWTLAISATANTSTTPRAYSFYSNAPTPTGWSGSVYGQNGVMWIGRPHYIYQAGVNSFSIGSTSQSVGKDGGAFSVNVTATPTTAAWTATVSDNAKDWITLYRTDSSGSGVLGYVVAENTSDARQGKITVAGKTLTIKQSAGISTPTYYTVTFNANGGTCSTSSKQYSSGSTLGTLPTATKSGYTLDGWYTSGGTKVSPSTVVTGNMTLYAHWTANTYTVSYVLDGGTHGSTHPTSARYDTAFQVSAPMRSGYAFAGWTVTSGLNTSTAKWGTTSSPSTAISSATTKCVNGATGSVWFKNLTPAAGTTVTLTANWTPDSATLESLTIYGISSVTSGERYTYTCKANYSDRTSVPVSPTWSIRDGASYASIGSSTGVLTAMTVSSQQDVVIRASYGGISKDVWVIIKPNAVLAAKVIVENGGKTLRFVYDSSDYGTKDVNWFAFDDVPSDPYYNPPWYSCRATVTEVVFDDSFASYRPQHCGSWFYEFENLQMIKGIGNLDISAAFSLAWMFDGCSSLSLLDLSGFDTAGVEDMSYMFFGCSSLEKVYASDKFVTTKVSDSFRMFYNCPSLVGGMGTRCDGGSRIDATYARIDGGASLPGYFTAKSSGVGGAVVRFNANGGTGSMAQQTFELGRVYKLPKCTLTPPKGKTRFAGWAGSNGRRYDDEMLVFNLGDVTMTAIWQ